MSRHGCMRRSKRFAEVRKHERCNRRDSVGAKGQNRIQRALQNNAPVIETVYLIKQSRTCRSCNVISIDKTQRIELVFHSRNIKVA